MRPERRIAGGVGGTGAGGLGVAAFLTRHDALSQQRVAIVAHVVGVSPFALFRRHRAALETAGGDHGLHAEAEWLTASSLLMVRSASELAAGDAPDTPSVARAALEAAGRGAPAWRHPDPWTLLAPRVMRPLRALVHLDPAERDLAILQWLGVDPGAAAAGLGLDEEEYRSRRDRAMAFWAHLVREEAE